MARPPVQNAIGSPHQQQHQQAAEQQYGEPFDADLESHASGSPPRHDQDVLEQLADPLQQQQRGADGNRELDRPVLDAPFGERVLVELHGVQREARTPVQSIVPMKMKKNTDVTMSQIALPRVDSFE